MKGKFVVAHDTIVDGWQCMQDEHGNPVLFDTTDEAFAEIFEGNLLMLEAHNRDGQLEEYNEGVTKAMLDEMREIYERGNVDEMNKFMARFPECDDSGEWVEPFETYIPNRKTMYPG